MVTNPIRPATIIESLKLNRLLRAEIVLASETFQVTGSFKFRAAWNVASSVANKHIITASSGNFGQALACACEILGKHCTIVMPHTSAEIKIVAAKNFGANIQIIDTNNISRKKAVQQLADRHPEAYVASSFDDPLVIAGNASLGYELAVLKPRPDIVIVPVGGGGLSAGIVSAFRQVDADIKVVGAEPELGNDAALSMRAGKIIANEKEPLTIADGARTLSLGQHNWKILQNGLEKIVEVTEEQIERAVGILYHYANLKVEPTGALSLAAVLSLPELCHNARVCCIISGGNIDTDVFTKIINNKNYK